MFTTCEVTGASVLAALALIMSTPALTMALFLAARVLVATVGLGDLFV